MQCELFVSSIGRQFSCFLFLAPHDTQRVSESLDGIVHLLAGSYGNADTAVAAGVAGTVANENAVFAHEAYKLGMLGTNLNQDEIGMAWPAADARSVERSFELSARRNNFACIPLDISSIFKSWRQTGKREGVDAVG